MSEPATAARHKGMKADDVEEQLPQSQEAERSVLGAILLAPAALQDVTPILEEGDFCDEKNRRIYRTMIGLSQRKAAIDPVTLMDEFSRNGGAEKAGGAAYLSALMGGVPDIGNVESYARIVKEKSVLRRLIRVGQKLTRGALAEEQQNAGMLLAEVGAELRVIEQEAQRAAITADGISELDLPDGWLRGGEVLQASPLPKARFKTGIPALDEASRGGLPTGAVVVFQGEPDAGKTGLALQIVLKIAMEQDVVAVLFTPDGGRENAEGRLGALLGFDARKLEERDEAELAALRARLADRRIYFPDHSREETTFESIMGTGRRIRPELPHVYLADSVQECRADEEADELDERRRVVALMRALQKAATSAVPTICLACSQTNTASFASRKPKDRTRPIAAGAESGKIAFLSSMIVHLDGDPSKGPDFGRAQIVKSKLGGPKRTFGLKLDPRTTELEEIDAAIVEQERTEQRERQETDHLGRLGERALQILLAHGPLSVSQIHGRIGGRRQDLLNALNGLEAQGAATWKAGPRGARLWEAVRRG